MFDPIKIGFGGYMTRFYNEIVPTTKPIIEYTERGIEKSIMFAPARMVDAAEDMLSLFRRNDTDNAATKPANLPVIIIAFDSDYTPTGREYNKQVSDFVDITIPSDTKNRYFRLKVINADLRVQIAFFAQDEGTAKSLAAQFCLFIDSIKNRRFNADYTFSSLIESWGVTIETSDVVASKIDTDSKNINILTVDITLHSRVPIYDAPKETDANNDGKGTNFTDDLSGYKLVEIINHEFIEPES